MSSRSVLRRFAAPLLLALGSPVTLDAAATHHYRGTPTIDGIESGNEWSSALVGTAYVGGGPDFVLFYAMNDDSNLYLAARFPYGTSPASPAFVELGALAFGQPACDEFSLHSQDSTTQLIDLYWTDCIGPGLSDENAGGSSDTTGAWGIFLSTLFFELTQPLDDDDDAHDMNAPAPGFLWISGYAAHCDSAFACEDFASLNYRMFLETENTIFFADFEDGTLLEWSLPFP